MPATPHTAAAMGAHTSKHAGSVPPLKYDDGESHGARATNRMVDAAATRKTA